MTALLFCGFSRSVHLSAYRETRIGLPQHRKHVIYAVDTFTHSQNIDLVVKGVKPSSTYMIKRQEGTSDLSQRRHLHSAKKNPSRRVQNSGGRSTNGVRNTHVGNGDRDSRVFDLTWLESILPPAVHLLILRRLFLRVLYCSLSRKPQDPANDRQRVYPHPPPPGPRPSDV